MSGIRAAAAELGHRVSLVDALGIVLVMAARQERGYERAAAKWLARLTLERPAVRLDDLRLALTALEALPHSPDTARQELADVCGRHRLDNVVGLLS
jgi:hypothetical protein